MFDYTVGYRKVKQPRVGSPSFAQLKKNESSKPSKWIYKFRQKLKCKPYLITNINEMLLKLEGFQYDMSLDLNMVHDHIWSHEDASNLCRIILPQGKYCYKCIPMVVRNSPEIFQQKWIIYYSNLNLFMRI